MVRAVDDALVDNAAVEMAPFVVEVVGPAGAGKTSLARALTQSNERLVEGAKLRARSIPNIPFFVRNAFFLLPTFLQQYRNGRGFTWQEIKAIVHLRGWHRVLRRRVANGTITILDQGPIFMLTRLRVLGPENIKRQGFDRWWNGMFKQWSHELDLVIWLDAPDAILLERIHSRNKRHTVKEESEKDAHEFMARYRTSYEEVISALRANDGPRVVRFDTARQSPGEITDKVLTEFDLEHRQG